MKNNKQTGDPPKLKFLGRSQNPNIFNNIKKNVTGGYPKKGVNTDHWTELKKFENGDTLVEYNTLYKDSNQKASLAPNWALRDAATGKYHALDNFGDVETLKKLFFGGPVDPLKPMTSSQESIGIKPQSIMPFNINPYTSNNVLEGLKIDMKNNPITKADQDAYRMQKTQEVAPTRRFDRKIPMNMQREKANGGLLTKGEYNLVNSLKQLLDKPVSNVAPKKYSAGGKILSALAGAIPVVGSVVSPMVGLIDQQIEKNNAEQASVITKPMNMNTGIYGNQMATGGLVTPNGVTVSNTAVRSNKKPFGKKAAMIAGVGALGAAAGIAANAFINKQRNKNKVEASTPVDVSILRASELYSPDVSNYNSLPIDTMSTQPDISEAFNQVGTPTDSNMAMYGKRLAKGGLVTKNFKQYNTGSHASGNDLNINEGGSPSNAASTASVQNQENAYTSSKGGTYVHSDILTNPESGNTFNVDAAKLNKKFSKADKSPEDKNALDFTMNRLSLINDKVRTMQESVQMALGGTIKKLYNGGPLFDKSIKEATAYWKYNHDPNDYPPMQPAFDNTNVIPQNKGVISTSNEELDPTNIKKVQDLSILPAFRETSKLPDLSGLIKPNGKESSNRSTASGDYNYNIPAMVLKGIGLGKSAVDALTPSEVERTILPDYTKSDKEMYSTNIDYTQAKQDALAAANMASNVNRSASGSFEQFQGREANNFANLADNLGRTSMKEALDRNQQRVQRAGYEQNKSLDTANRNTQNRINNQMNQANADLADQKFFSELTDIGSQFNKYDSYKDMVTNKKELAQAAINEGIALMGTKYANFGFSDDFMEKITSGTASIDEMTQFIATTQEIKKKESKKTETKKSE